MIGMSPRRTLIELIRRPPSNGIPIRIRTKIPPRYSRMSRRLTMYSVTPMRGSGTMIIVIRSLRGRTWRI